MSVVIVKKDFRTWMSSSFIEAFKFCVLLNKSKYLAINSSCSNRVRSHYNKKIRDMLNCKNYKNYKNYKN